LVKAEHNSRLHEFLASVCTAFSGVVDVSDPITIHGFRALLDRIRDRFQQFDRTAAALRQGSFELESVRQTVRAPQTANAAVAVTGFVRSVKNIV
jgi:hypothetical protein